MGEVDDRDETTITEADAESDTWRSLLQGTQTRLTAEADDWAGTGKGVETATFVDGEGGDRASSPELTTKTGARGEADDWAE